jgi:phage shock protein A
LREKAHNSRIQDANDRMDAEIRDLKGKIERQRQSKEMKKRAIEMKKKTKDLSSLSSSLTTDLELTFKTLVQDFISSLESHQADFKIFRDTTSDKYE